MGQICAPLDFSKALKQWGKVKRINRDIQAHKEESGLSIDSVVLKIDGVFFEEKNA